MRTLVTLIVCGTLITGTLVAQVRTARSPWQDPSTRNFAEIQRQAQAYYANNPRGKHSGYKQWKRWEYATQYRLLPNGEIANSAALNWRADQKVARESAAQRAQVYGGTWDLLAPVDGYVASGGSPGIGRVNVIAFHPTDPNTVFAGTPAGGLWKTSSAGVDWTPLTDGIPSIGVSGIAIHPTQPNIIYILTGDGDGAHTYSIGVLKTTDGGVNWATTGLTWDVTELNKGYKLVMHPADPQILMVACNDGILRTTDGGTVWDTVQAGSFTDLEFKPDNPTVVYAARNDRFYRSDNSGATWTEYNSGLPTGESRIAIAVTPDNPDYVYYLAGPGGPTGNFKGLYRSVDSGETWAVRITSPNILDGSVAGDASCASGCDQATYDLAIAIDPDDAEEVITGGINLWRDENGGGLLMQLVTHWIIGYASEYVHGDIHELVFQDNNTLWCGSDGGIFRSLDDGVTWQDMSSVGSYGLGITQFYRIAGTPTNANLMIGGAQDNGTNMWTGGNTIWHFAGNDGMDCIIDYTNQDILYLSTQNGGLRKSTDGGLTHNPIKPGNSNGGWVTPMVMDPVNPQRIYAGFRDTVWRSDNGGSSWTPTITAVTLRMHSALAIAPSDPDRIYAAKSDNVYRSDSIGVGWIDITGTL
ncbi:MAG: glycosyl hydrolase, partial [Saprospiraceae bacterium]|nr:glycosyl hydrolase [Saprospiraceae bacterium]